MAQPREPAGEDVALTYFGLRNAIGAVGLALPVVLLTSGIIDGHVQDSISTYYYTRMRDYLTGSMCVIGVFLFCYRFGTWRSEGLLAKVAGLAAFGVAFFHTAPSGPASLLTLRLSDVHLICAAILFAILGAFSFVYFPAARTQTEQREHVPWVYRALGVLIWSSIALSALLNWVCPDPFGRHNLLFWLESIAVLAFSAAFLVKGRFVERAVRPAVRSLVSNTPMRHLRP